MTTKPITAPLTADATSGWRIRAYQIAWGLALCFYFLEYASRSAPAVMIEHLATAFGTTAIGVSAILEPIITLTQPPALDRKSTRLNSSHANISYAVFFFKKKKLINKI